MLENYKHTTVLLDEAVNGLNIRSNGIYIDGTFGRGGHSRSILSPAGPKGACWQLTATLRRLQPPNLLKILVSPSRTRPTFELSHYVRARTGRQIDGVLPDLGVSRCSLTTQTGVSSMRDGPLDMRMDPSTACPPPDWLMKAEADDIAWC